MTNLIWFKFLAITGAVFAVLGTVIAGIIYRGKEGERYSPFNHFISELGEMGVSRLAPAFNLGLILSGITLIPAALCLGMTLPGVLAKLGMAAGVICAVSLALVGIFPMNKTRPHGKAAVTFFRTGLAMVAFFSLAIAFQEGDEVLLSRGYALAGLPPILAFGAFLILIGRAYQEDDEPLAVEGVQRPKFWHLAAVEWSIFLAVLLWFILLGLGLG
ncbi:MAG: DUF998 domain-containing protein [Brevefilum sp.]